MWIPAATGMGNLTTALWNKGRGSIEIVVHVQYVQIGRSANGANAMIKYAPTYNIRYGRDVTTERANLDKDIDEIIYFPLMENEIEQLFREQIHERSKCKMVKKVEARS